MTKTENDKTAPRPKRAIVSREQALERMSSFPERAQKIITAINNTSSQTKTK
ncbi:MAG TPA: hypothetical protein VK557_05980 [Pyrinomonadaceae bacterium]|nr:hypothetical protein [Pyrinomonadaceae bacterium]